MKSVEIAAASQQELQKTVQVPWRSLENLTGNKGLYGKLNFAAAVVDTCAIQPDKLTALHTSAGFNCISTVLFSWLWPHVRCHMLVLCSSALRSCLGLRAVALDKTSSSITFTTCMIFLFFFLSVPKNKVPWTVRRSFCTQTVCARDQFSH